MRDDEFFRRRIWAHFLRRMTPQKTGVWNALAFHCSNSSARLRQACGISAAIQAAWASNNFAKQNYDQPLARPSPAHKIHRRINAWNSGSRPEKNETAASPCIRPISACYNFAISAGERPETRAI
jgi:hypothetical protein